MYTPNNGASKKAKQKRTEPKGETDTSQLYLGDSNTPISEIGRKSARI